MTESRNEQSNKRKNEQPIERTKKQTNTIQYKKTCKTFVESPALFEDAESKVPC